MKEMILGLAAGMVAGAALVRNCKPCAQFVDEVTTMATSKMKSQSGSHQQQKSSDCECGSDCGCSGNYGFQSQGNNQSNNSQSCGYRNN